MRKSLVLLAAMALLLGALSPANAGRGNVTETADVLGQMLNPDTGEADPDDGVRELYAADAASLRRTANGIQTKIKMPTPEPGTYAYPDPDAFPTVSEPGHPEGFTLWVFVFDPDAEQAVVGGEEVPWTGAFLGAGHLVGGDTLTLSGEVTTNTEPFVGNQLENPWEADVHLTVAPHGAVDSDIMPEQIQTPGGGPQHWWVALFDEAG